MSLLDKLKSFFSGGSDSAADAHAGHDHAAGEGTHDHEHGMSAPAEPYVPPAPPADPMGAPMTGGMPESESDAQPAAERDEQP